MSTILTNQELERFEPTAKILAANGIAQSLSFTLERKYLNGISSCSSPMHLEYIFRSIPVHIPVAYKA